MLIESFRPGLMASWGLDGDTLRATNPRLVSCSVTAFGTGEQAAGLPGYDFLLQAMGGLMSVTGEADGRPLKAGAALIDLVCGLLAVTGIQAALAERERTGRGRHVEVSLMDSALVSLINQGSAWVSGGVVPARRGNRHPSIVPYETYEASDRPFALAAGNDRLFARLCEAIGLAELPADPRFATNAARVANVDALADAVQRRLPHAPGRPLGRGPARRERAGRPDQPRRRGVRAGRRARHGAGRLDATASRSSRRRCGSTASGRRSAGRRRARRARGRDPGVAGRERGGGRIGLTEGRGQADPAPYPAQLTFASREPPSAAGSSSAA